ncbi:phosphatase PAP2 family protein [Brevibacillus migulae]|uniref:phosphatase PAP2 family protein n=1 Tax=Brevibacillus migulae TaxID=1644114 RepID=UPI00106DF38D|nr:phosphatase PAP2 family protein [Brevibacillus migulae]
MQFGPAKSPERSLLWAALLFAVGAMLVIAYLTGGFAIFDQQAFAWMALIRTEWLTSFMSALTHLGGSEGLIPIGVLLVALAIWKRTRMEAMFLLMALLGAEILNELAKLIFDRPRPADGNLIELPSSYSMPSGHAMISSALYIMLAYQIKRNDKQAGASWIVAFLYVLVIGVSLSRVYLGVHYFSDIAVGAAFGLSWYFVTRYAYEKALLRWRTPIHGVPA